MQKRALILLGFKKVDQSGKVMPVENLYTGQDGVELIEAHRKAVETGEYAYLGKMVNPPLTHMPIVIDPPIKRVPLPERKGFQVPEKEGKTPAELAQEKERQTEDERRQAAVDKDARDMQIIQMSSQRQKQFNLLYNMTIADLKDEFQAMAADKNADELKSLLPDKPKKVDYVNAILQLQGFNSKKEETSTVGENESQNQNQQ